MQKHRAQVSDARRARTLAVALAFVLGGAALYVKGVVSQPVFASQDAAASPSTYPSDSFGSSMLAVTAPAKGRENVPAAPRGAAPTVTAWASPGASLAQRR